MELHFQVYSEAYYGIHAESIYEDDMAAIHLVCQQRDDYDGKFVENGPNIVIHCAIKDMIVDSLSKLKTISRPLRHRRGS